MNDFLLCILGNLSSDSLQTSINEISAAFTGKNNSDTLPVTSWKWASTERQQLLGLETCQSWHRADSRAHNRTIDCLDWQKYSISKEKHGYENNWYRKMQTMHNEIIRCWIHHFDGILLTHCKNKSLIWIYRWTWWATRWRPTRFVVGRRWTSSHTGVDCSGVLTTWTAHLAMVRFGTGPRAEVTVWNHC